MRFRLEPGRNSGKTGLTPNVEAVATLRLRLRDWRPAQQIDGTYAKEIIMQVPAAVLTPIWTSVYDY